MVIAYLRVSTGKQHLENQKDEIMKFTAKRGMRVDRWITEIASGKKKEKDRELGRLMKALKPGDTLIVTELSRLSRTLLDVMSIMSRCLEKKITLYSTKDGYAFDNNINSKVLAFAFGLVAEIEHNLISARTREALAARKSVGMQLGRPRGSSPKMQRLIDNKEQVITMLRSGKTVSDICRHYEISRDTFYNFKETQNLSV